MPESTPSISELRESILSLANDLSKCDELNLALLIDDLQAIDIRLYKLIDDAQNNCALREEVEENEENEEESDDE